MFLHLNNEYQSVQEFSYADCGFDDTYLQRSNQRVYHRDKHIEDLTYIRAVLLNLLNK